MVSTACRIWLSRAAWFVQIIPYNLLAVNQTIVCQVLLASTSADDHQPAALYNASRTVVGSETRVVVCIE